MFDREKLIEAVAGVLSRLSGYHSDEEAATLVVDAVLAALPAEPERRNRGMGYPGNDEPPFYAAYPSPAEPEQEDWKERALDFSRASYANAQALLRLHDALVTSDKYPALTEASRRALVRDPDQGVEGLLQRIVELRQSAEPEPKNVERTLSDGLQRIVDLRGTEDESRLIASKALGDAAEYRNTGTVAWKNPLAEPVRAADPVRAAAEALEAAAREVDRHLDPGNRGAGTGGRWSFGGQRVSAEASQALLILHDCLNDVRHYREAALAADREPCPTCKGRKIVPDPKLVGKVPADNDWQPCPACEDPMVGPTGLADREPEPVEITDEMVDRGAWAINELPSWQFRHVVEGKPQAEEALVRAVLAAALSAPPPEGEKP